MTWFKNLRTVSKLILVFGFICLLTGVVGYQGIGGMNNMNSMLGRFSETELPGMVAIKDVYIAVTMSGRHLRQTMIELDRSALGADREKLEKDFADIDEAIGRAEKYFYTEEGKTQVAILRQTLPEYRALNMEAAGLAVSGDTKAAIAAMPKIDPVGDRMRGAIAKATAAETKNVATASDESARLYQRSRTVMIVLMLAAIGIALGVGMLTARLISHPLGQTVDVLEAVAQGDLVRTLEVSTRDEVGRMAKALNAAVEGMRQALQEVRGSADNLATASQQLASGSEQLSSGAQEQASSLEQTTASLEEITTSVRQNADSAKQAAQLAAAARDTAEKGGQVVSSAVSAMGEINTASNKIADIITAIDEIAFQTNLLALNAAVEAARAGEQGRGFAVVAAEVRTLAQRSATAAKEIKALIQDSVRKVEAGSQMVNQSGDVLVEIVSSVKRVTDIVGEIAAASREQSAGVEQVSKAMAQMDQITQQNASQTEELSSTAQGLSSSAEQLQALVDRFRLEDERAARQRAKDAPRKFNSAGPSNGLHALSQRVGVSAHPASSAALQPSAGLDTRSL